MAVQLDPDTFTGAHPTNRDLVDRLRAWGFTQRRTDGRGGARAGDRDGGVHLQFRGPHGGSVRVLRSLLGRADADTVAKAARLARVDVAQFWSGPGSTTDSGSGTSTSTETGEASTSAVCAGPAGDRIVSVVLAVHAGIDRPLGFDQVVELCKGRLTRAQVRSASATLCRDGDLQRVRSGVYQWASGHRAGRPHPAGPARPYRPGGSEPTVAEPGSAVEWFERMFPDGVQMTAELLADFEQWTRLTTRLAASTGSGTGSTGSEPHPAHHG